MKITKKLFVLLGLCAASFSTAATKTVVFQQGLNSYTGCTDNELRSQERLYGKGPVDSVMKITEL